MTARPRHPIFARVYARISAGIEREGGADRRGRLLAGLSGRVIEVGAGNGLNFAHYPREVTGVLAVEPEPYLREAARRSAALAPVSVDVVDGIAEQLPAGDDTIDAVIASRAIESSGFRIDRVDRFRFPDSGPTTPTSPHVLGVAMKR